MDDALKRRLTGATVLLLAAFALTLLLPGPDRGGDAQPVVSYDLRTGKPLNLPPSEPAPKPVRLKPVEIGSAGSLDPGASVVPKPVSPDTGAGNGQEGAPEASAPKPEAKPEAKPAAKVAEAPAPQVKPQSTSPSKPAVSAANGGRPALKVDERFSTGDSGWFVQIGSFSSRDNARVEMQKLFKLGLPAMMQNITVGKKLWYRVRVGPYASEAPAQQALASLHARGYAAAKVVRPDSSAN